MKFTQTDLQQIERTLDKLLTVSSTVWDTDSEDFKNARKLSYIIGEMRVCAALVVSDERNVRVSGFDRLDDLIGK